MHFILFVFKNITQYLLYSCLLYYDLRVCLRFSIIIFYVYEPDSTFIYISEIRN